MSAGLRTYVLLGLAIMLVVLPAAALREARRPPRIISYALRAGLPCGQPPLRIVVIGDIHALTWATPPAAVATLVRLANAAHPDLVLLAGDYMTGGWDGSRATAERALAPLAGLKSRYGVVAVLGNNDRRDGPVEITRVLRAMRIAVLDNEAWLSKRVAVIGVGDLLSGVADPELAAARYASALKALDGPPPPVTLWLTHNPLLFDRLGRTGDLLIAAHTHGGQILPRVSVPVMRWIAGGGASLVRFGGWSSGAYVRGYYQQGAKRMIVTSGVGTSKLPFRLGVPPEIVLLTLAGCGA